jgi:monoamine oxidase
VTDVDVVVVGAGVAGLTTARQLVAAGVEVAVLEARRRVGGRTEHGPVPGHDGVVVELGGQWIGPAQTRITELVTTLDLRTFDHHNNGELVVDLDGRRTRMPSHRGAVPRLNPLVLADLAQAQLRLERLARRVPLEAPWTAAGAGTRDARTFASWIAANVHTRWARSYLRVATEALFAADPRELSLLHVLFYLHSGGGLEALMSFDDGAQQQRIVGGATRIAEGLAAELGARVRLGRPVRAIVHRRDGTGRHLVEVAADGGPAVTARRVVVTLPPTLAGRLRYDPPLPAARDQLTQRLPAGSVIKLHAVYPEPFWRADGLTGTIVSDRSPVGLVVDNSPPQGTPGILTGFVEGRAARQLSARDATHRRQVLVEALAGHLGRQAATPTAYLERDWSAEEYTRGCYGAHFPPGVWTSFGRELRAPVGAIHWAGAETAAVGNGYLEGAARSGDRAAAEVLAALA